MTRTWLHTLGLKNFQKYREIQFVFSDSGNLVVGRNGSGKSTIVAGIVLALGGTGKILGKSLPVHEFIRHGETKAVTELVLVTTAREVVEQLLGRSVVATNGQLLLSVTRVITPTSSSFMINGEQCSAVQVKELAHRLGIYVESLAQCLPQDRVTEFSTLSEEEQLELTLKTCCPETLVRKRELEQVDDVLSQQSQVAQKQQAALAEKQNELAVLAEEAERLQVLLKRKEQIQLIQGKIKWIDYQAAKHEYDWLGQRQSELQRVEAAQAAACQEKQREYDQLLAALANRALPAAELPDFTGMSAQVRQIQQLAAQAQSVAYQQETLAKQRASLSQEQASIEALLANSQSVELPAPLFLPAYQAELAELERETRLKSLQDSEWQLQSRLKAEEIKTLELAVQAQENQVSSLMASLRQFHPDTHAAVKLIQESGQDWAVDLPAFLTLKVTREEFAAEVSSQLSFHALTTFVCHTKASFHAFVQEFKEKRRLSISVTEKQPEGFVPPVPAVIQPKYQMVYLSACVSGPSAMLEFLNVFAKLAFIPATKTRINSAEFFQDHPKVLRAIASQTIFEIKRSAYTKHPTTVIYPMPKGLGLERAKPDADLNLKLTALKDEREQRAAERNQMLRTLEVLTRRMDELRGLKDADAKHQEKYLRAKRAITINQDRLQEIGQETAALLAKEATEQQRLAELSQQELKLFKQLAPSPLLKAFQRVTVHAKQVHAEQEHAQARRDELLQEQAEHRRLKQEISQLVSQLQEAELTARSRRKEAEQVIKVDTPELKSKLKQLPNDSAELGALLAEEQAKVELAVIDMSAITTHEACKREVQAQRALLEQQQVEAHALAQEKQRAEVAVRQEIDCLIGQLNQHVHQVFLAAKTRGALSVEYLSSPRRWKLALKVQFRADKPLESLSAGRQSGGEKSVSILLYLLSMQHYAQSSFFLVDEVNQGMDATHERCIHNLLLGPEVADSRQTIVITPKLVSNLKYSDNTKVHVIVEAP